MRILISTDTYYPNVNGASYFAQRLAHYLSRRGHQILVVAPSTSFGFETKSVNGIDIFGVWSLSVLMYKGFRVVFPFGIQKKIESEILNFKPDIIHVQGHFTVSRAVIRAARKFNIKVVGTNHFMPENLTHYLPVPSSTERKIINWAWSDFRKIYEQLDAVTTPTESAANLMKQYGFSKPITAISNGIDLSRFNPSKRDDSIRVKYKLPDAPLLFFVGRLDKEKRLDFVIRALAQVPRDVSIHFAIAGNGAEKQKLINLVNDLGLQDRVTFLGFVPDDELPALCATAYCFVNAGTAELQSIAAMEAMASGLPILASNSVALPELVRNGENGYLFEKNDNNSLTSFIVKIFSDSSIQKKMSEMSLEMIKKHDIGFVIMQFESLYRDLINRE